MENTIVFWIIYLIGAVATFCAIRRKTPEEYRKIVSYNVICALISIIFPVSIGCYILVAYFEDQEE